MDEVVRLDALAALPEYMGGIVWEKVRGCLPAGPSFVAVVVGCVALVFVAAVCVASMPSIQWP